MAVTTRGRATQPTAKRTRRFVSVFVRHHTRVKPRDSPHYNFLSCVLPYTNADWEKRSIFLNFLVPKLPAPEEDDLSKGILETIEEDADRVRQLITETIPARVAADTAFRNAQQNSDKQNARIEHDKALVRVMTSLMKDDTQLFKQFMDNEGFKRWMSDASFELAYRQPGEG